MKSSHIHTSNPNTAASLLRMAVKTRNDCFRSMRFIAFVKCCYRALLTLLRQPLVWFLAEFGPSPHNTEGKYPPRNPPTMNEVQRLTFQKSFIL